MEPITTSRIKVAVSHTLAGEPRIKVRVVAPNASDFTTSRRRKNSKTPEAKPVIT